MAVARGPFLAAVLLLVSSGLLRCSPLPACTDPCTCQRAPLLNCSSSGLSLVPQPIQDFVTELDLSHNLLDSVTLDRPHRKLRSVWLGNNNITRLSLCVERDLGARHVRGRHLHHLRPWSRQGCVSWAPALQLLSVERNQLEQLPEGLDSSESLQVLQLSFNRISTLRSTDLGHLRQLVELHLQHNLITSLHPQTFQDLTKLQVLDLSFNKFTSLHTLMYPSLHYIGVDVRLGGNRWQCDCRMRSLRRWMTYDSSRGLQTWSVVCAFPSILSGKDLLQLEEDDLNCSGTENRPELHQDVTVYSGSEILLSCSTKDSTWWTPSGQASTSNPEAGLLISDITERDTGLYVCLSEEHEVASVFNLQISKVGGARRKTRSLPRTSQQTIPQDAQNRIGEERNQGATQSQLALAVCLSILFTFLIAFILGVLARPCIDVLWRRITKKKRTETEANSVSSAEQRQYDNEAYSNGEEQEERPEGSHRERRVTFSTVDYRESPNVQYYDTVASGDQESINSDSEVECDAAKAERDTNTAGDSGSESSLQQSSPDENRRDGRNVSDRKHNIEFEHIPDPVELKKKRSSSSSSDSSLSDKVFNEDQRPQRDHTTQHSKSRLTEDSVQQRADFKAARKVEVPQISVEGSEIPGFTSEPFADWSPHRKGPNLTDPDLWQETEEQFEFSDQSSTVAPTSDKQKRNMSSSSSSVSEDEITEYTVNSDQEEQEKNIDRNHNKPDITNAYLKQDASFQQKIYGVDPIMPSVRLNQGDYRYDTERRAERPKLSSSSHSSDSDGEDYTVKQEKDKGKGKEKSRGVSDRLSSKIVTREGDTMKKVEPMPRTKWPVPNLVIKSQDKSLDARASSPPAAYSSSSSSESEADIADLKMEQNTSRVNAGIKINQPGTLSTDLDRQCIPQIKRYSDVNAPSSASDSTSSDESADEITKHIKRQEKGGVDMAGLPIKEYQSLNYDYLNPPRPSQNLGNVTPIKRHMDIRAQSPPPDSSSSSEDETHHRKKQEKGQVPMARLPVKVSQTVSHDPQTQWPLVDLEHTTKVKRRLDIKAPSKASESSSSSDSEDETTHHTERPGKMDIAGLPFQVSEEKHHDPEIWWPLIDLEHTTKVKRHLDIKAPSPPPDSSSSSDSEDQTTSHKEKQEQGQVYMAKLPVKVSQTVSHDPQTQWPLVDLRDIKGPSQPSESSSSSDSEGETTHHTMRPGNVGIAGPPFQESQARHNPQWPALDLENTTSIKRRLDIKASSPHSSSSDSEDEMHHTKKERPELGTTVRLTYQESQKASHDPDTHLKRDVDIKTPSPASDSSSSSDSEDDAIYHIKKQEQGKIDMARVVVSQTLSDVPQTQWPALDLEHTTRIKRRLDIKAPSPDSNSSPSSHSEDETCHLDKQRPGKVGTAGLLFQKSQTESHDPETQWPAVDLGNMIRIKRRLDIKAPSPASDSSSSSDSEDETTHHIKKQEQRKIDMARVPINVSQTLSDVQQTQWPALDLEHTTRIKRRLDIKAPSPDSYSSSSSDSEDETGHLDKQRPGKVGTAGLPFKKSQTESRDPDTQWPTLDLKHTTTHIKRRLDIKAPSPASDSSSSSGSEDEATHHTKKEKAELVGIAGHPFQEFQTKSHDQETQWPAVDLGNMIRIKRRMDIKVPSPASDSSSSSDSEDETTHHITKQEQRKIDMARVPINVSQTLSDVPQTQWPALDLEHTTRIKRRLDIKAPSPDSNSSSSSHSEDETGHLDKPRPGKVGTAGLPFKKSQTESRDPDTQWPTLDLKHTTTHIKRRLDIKAPSPASDSSSSSSSEDEATHHTKKEKAELVGIAGHPFQEFQTKSHDPETQWPAVDLGNMTRIKRHLDIKAPSPASDSSSSSDSEDEATHHTKESPKLVEIAGLLFQKSQTVRHDTETQWPAVDLGNNTHIKRRLDIKVPSSSPDSLLIGGRTIHTAERKSSSSSSSDEQGEGMEDLSNPPTTVEPDPDSRWFQLGLSSAFQVKRRLDIKAPSPQPDPILSSVSPGYQQSELNSSSSDCEDENRNHAKLGVSAISKTSRSPKTPVINTPHSLNTDYIKLEKYTVITDEVGDKMTSDNIMATPLINPELESRWATMNLGISRFRKRLEITSHTPPEPPNLPSSPPPDSFSSSSSEKENGSQSSKTRQKRKGIAMQGNIQRESSLTPKNKPVVKEGLRKDYSLTKTKEKSNIPNTKRSLDIKREASSSSSENETMDHSVPDRSRGVPRVKTNLNVKAPLPGSSNSSSSSSESENEVTGDSAKQSRHASNMSGMTEDSMITYKRVIFKPSSPTKDDTNQRHTGVEVITVAHQSPSHGAGGSNASLAPRRVPSMSFDDVVKKRIEESKSTTDVDVPPEIMWTGLGCQLPDLSVSSPRRQLDVGLLTPQRAPPSDSLASIRALNTFENSFRSTNEGAVPEDRRERKGLSALKAMSSERRKWDTQGENSVTDLLDGIPHYRRHDIGGTEPLQQAPPPIPATPPPFEAVELKWNSPQSNKKQGSDGTRYNLQQESDPSSIMSPDVSVYFESSNISHV